MRRSPCWRRTRGGRVLSLAAPTCCWTSVTGTAAGGADRCDVHRRANTLGRGRALLIGGRHTRRSSRRAFSPAPPAWWKAAAWWAALCASALGGNVAHAARRRGTTSLVALDAEVVLKGDAAGCPSASCFSAWRVAATPRATSLVPGPAVRPRGRGLQHHAPAGRRARSGCAVGALDETGARAGCGVIGRWRKSGGDRGRGACAARRSMTPRSSGRSGRLTNRSAAHQ